MGLTELQRGCYVAGRHLLWKGRDMESGVEGWNENSPVVESGLGVGTWRRHLSKFGWFAMPSAPDSIQARNRTVYPSLALFPA